jgi:hypothetical protein
MKIIDANSYQEIRTWIIRNARPIELSLWQYFFENGSQDSVLNALSIYQNKDGGFGNALEPDNWNPNSSPYTTAYAIGILEHIDFHDINHPIMQGIVRFLESKVHFAQNMWAFSISTNDNYPHAPWWTYNEEANKTESIGITAALASFIVKNVEPDSDLYQMTIVAIEQLVEILTTQNSFGDMGIGGYFKLLETIQQTNLTLQFDYSSLVERIKTSVNNSIQKDVTSWETYGVRPSNYIECPNSIFYQGNESVVEKELDYLIDTRPKGNVWDITWSWFDNNEKYPKEFAISENWWKAEKAIEKLLFLRNFNRLNNL